MWKCELCKSNIFCEKASQPDHWYLQSSHSFQIPADIAAKPFRQAPTLPGDILLSIATAPRPHGTIWPMKRGDSAFNPRVQQASFTQTFRMRVRRCQVTLKHASETHPLTPAPLTTHSFSTLHSTVTVVAILVMDNLCKTESIYSHSWIEYMLLRSNSHHSCHYIHLVQSISLVYRNINAFWN